MVFLLRGCPNLEYLNVKYGCFSEHALISHGAHVAAVRFASLRALNPFLGQRKARSIRLLTKLGVQELRTARS